MSCHWGNLSWGWQTFFFEKPVLQTRIKSICVCFFKPIQWNRLHRFYPLYPNVIEVQYKIIGTLLHTEIWACKISTDMDISYEKPCSQSLLDQLLLGHWTMCYLYIVRLNPSYTLNNFILCDNTVWDGSNKALVEICVYIHFVMSVCILNAWNIVVLRCKTEINAGTDMSLLHWFRLAFSSNFSCCQDGFLLVNWANVHIRYHQSWV